MKKTLAVFAAGIVLGAAGVFGWSAIKARDANNDYADELSKRDADFAKLKSQLSVERGNSDVLRKQIAAAAIDTSPVTENRLDIQRLLNDARPLMKSLALMFGEQRRVMTEKLIRGMAEKLAAEMGLTDEQTEDMIAHFLKLDAENFAKIKAMFDKPMTILDVFSVMKDMNPQKSMDDYVMTKMTDEQKKTWENKKLETKAQQLERTANRQIDRMKALNLDEDQKDRVFDILVKKNPQYDTSLAVEGLSTDGPVIDTAKSQDEAIAEVLKPEQMEEWQKLQERRANERKRLTDALGGFDPTQFFQGMEGGGFGGFGGRGFRGMGGGAGGGRRGR